MDIRHAKAIVTGGASGLGLATAKRFIDAGGYAVLLDVNADDGEARASELGDRCLFVRTDVSNEADVKTAVATAKDFMGIVIRAPVGTA